MSATAYPTDVPDVKAGLEALSQAECLQSLDELMSRRGHNGKDLTFMISLWRRERAAWGDARDARRAAKEAEE